MIILRKSLFSTEDYNNQIVEQREFNSKAAKELNNKLLKRIAAKNGIPVYESVGYKTKEIDPRVWKPYARHKQMIIDELSGNEVNGLINNGVPPFGTPNSETTLDLRRRGKKFYKRKDLEYYDHGVDDDFIIKNLDKSDIQLRKNILKSQRERRAGNL